MTKWIEAQDLILPDVPGCPWEMAKSRLIVAAREFCSLSAAWVETFETASAIGVADYPEIVTGVESEIVRVLECYYGTDEVDPTTPGDMLLRQVEDADVTGPPDHMCVVEDVLTLHPPPGEEGVTIKGRVHLKPSMAATGLPDHVWAQHIEAIVEGAKARLYASPKKPYTDLGMASVSRSAFLAGAGNARERAAKGSTRVARRVRAHYF